MSYIKLSQEEATQLNDILYKRLVSPDGGQTFLFPFQEGTTSYINPDLYEVAYYVDEKMIDVGSTDGVVSDLIANRVSRSEAINRGWIIEMLP